MEVLKVECFCFHLYHLYDTFPGNVMVTPVWDEWVTVRLYEHYLCFRNTFVNLVPVTGLRFNGDGYAALDTGYRFERFGLQLKFKTYAEDGILFMITGAPVSVPQECCCSGWCVQLFIVFPYALL